MDFDNLPEDKPSPQVTAPVSFDNLPEDKPSTQNFDDLPEDKTTDYSSPGQQAATIAENFAQGVLGPAATAIETANPSKIYGHGVAQAGPGPISTEKDILSRQDANPVEAGASKIAGNIASMMGTPELKLGTSFLAKVGSGAISNAIKTGAIAYGDEKSKAMLGDPTYDPNAVASHVASAGATGLFFGSIGGATSAKLESIAAKKAAEKAGTGLMNWTAGVGHGLTFPEGAVNPQNAEIAQKTFEGMQHFEGSPLDFKSGQKFAKKIIVPLISNSAKTKGAVIGGTLGGLAGGSIGSLIGQTAHGIEAGSSIGTGYGISMAEKYAPKVSQNIIGPMLLKMASDGKFQRMAQAIDYGRSIAAGGRAIGKGISSIFGAGAENYVELPTEKEREKIKNYVETEGPIKQVQEAQKNDGSQSFAEGGKVTPLPELNQPNVIADHWPNQNVMINSAKSRVYNYLNSARPLPSVSKLPYDPERKDPIKERKYNQLIDLAHSPLSILKKVKNGTLNHENLNDFVSMYPELHQELSRQITKRITEGQLKKETKPPYHVRQALSLFLGSNLDSTLSQPNIMAAQGVFAQQKAQQQRVNMSGMSKISQTAKTPAQARDEALTKT